MRNEAQPLQDSSPDQVVRHPERTGSPEATVAVPGTSAGEGTVIVDMDETLEGQEVHIRDLEHFPTEETTASEETATTEESVEQSDINLETANEKTEATG